MTYGVEGLVYIRVLEIAVREVRYVPQQARKITLPQHKTRKMRSEYLVVHRDTSSTIQYVQTVSGRFQLDLRVVHLELGQ